MKKLLLFTFSLIVLPLRTVFADPTTEFNNAHGDFFQLYAPQFRNLEMSYIYQPGTEEDGGAGEFDLQVYEAELKLPFPTGRDTYFSFITGLEARDYDFTALPGALTDSGGDTLYAIPIGAEIGIFPSDNFFFTGSATVGVYSNLNSGLKEDDFQVFGDLIAVYRLNPGALILGGVRVDNTFEDTSLYPLLGFRMRSSSGNLHLSLTVPREFTVIYSATKSFDLFGGLNIRGNKFRARGVGAAEDFNIYARDMRLGGGFTVWLGEHVNFGVEGGMLFESVFEYKVRNPGQFQGDLDTAPYVKGLLSFKL